MNDVKDYIDIVEERSSKESNDREWTNFNWSSDRDIFFSRYTSN